MSFSCGGRVQSKPVCCELKVNILCAVCSVQCAVCSVQCAVCSVPEGTLPMRREQERWPALGGGPPLRACRAGRPRTRSLAGHPPAGRRSPGSCRTGRRLAPAGSVQAGPLLHFALGCAVRGPKIGGSVHAMDIHTCCRLYVCPRLFTMAIGPPFQGVSHCSK